MAVTLFILGLPGSGKSTVFRHIQDYIQKQYQSWPVRRFKDYTYLNEMFTYDTEGKFTPMPPTNPKGFDINDMTILDNAENQLVDEAKRFVDHTQEANLVMIIEFARNDQDYRRAFHKFGETFLKDAYFLFLEVEKYKCKQRIHERVENWQTDDDHYVSEDIFDRYYKNENLQSFASEFGSVYDGVIAQIRVIANNGSVADIQREINDFIDLIIAQNSNNEMVKRL